MMDLIAALWRGDVPLVRTYWVLGVAAGLFFKIAFAYIAYRTLVFYTGVGLIFLLGVVAFSYAYFTFMSVAIWRSANKYKGLQRYAIGAKAVVILGVMQLIKGGLWLKNPLIF